MLKPHLATDADLTKLKFPLIAMSKIDGVRGINLNGTMTGRSLKPHGNKHVVNLFSGDHTLGFDGELALTGQETSPSLCRDTTSAVRSSDGMPNVTWHLFDYVAPHAAEAGYVERIEMLRTLCNALDHPFIRCVPYFWVHDVDQLLDLENVWLDEGYEGVILRDPYAPHKSGRATVKGGSYLRIKRFIDFEGEVVSFEEALENTNEAKTNELGRTERSTAQAGLVPKGMIGNVTLRALKNVEWNGQVLIAKSQLVTCGPGKLDHAQRRAFFEQPSLFVGHIWKAKFFPHGQKDKPRFPILLCERSLEDMSE
jgi:DNA ligase-1